MTTTMTPATKRQTWALFCATGLDWRDEDLSSDVASKMVGECFKVRGNKAKAIEICRAILGNKELPETKESKATLSMSDLYKLAHEEGMKAANECETHGPCGFAWVNVPANSRFGKYLMTNDLGSRDHYEGGVKLWVRAFGQSGNKKYYYAARFARILQENGVKKAKFGARED